MTQERLLKLAKTGVFKKLDREEEIAKQYEAKMGRKSKIQLARIEALWKEYDEITEMLKGLEK